jgi:hypothetical protein
MAGVQFPAEARDLSPVHCVQTGSEAHPASYSMGTQDSLPGGVRLQGCEADHSPPYAFMACCLTDLVQKHLVRVTHTYAKG